MNFWTREDINRILIQLDSLELPFKEYSFSIKNDKLICLGSGGSAYVFQGEDRGKHRNLNAIKVIGFSGHDYDTEIFNESVEAQKELGLLPYNLVWVFDHTELWVTLDENDNVVTAVKEKPEEKGDKCLRLQFVVMEKLEAVFKRSMAGNIHLTPAALSQGNEEEILKLAHDIGTALNRAHKRNILHRDVKLENVFYSEAAKVYKLGDFGVAKKTEDGLANTIAFTKGYAAPEVRYAGPEGCYDNTADIYSYGMMLFLLANGLKFPGSNTYNVNSGIQYTDGFLLPKPEMNISDGFFKLIQKACMYNPNDRYQSMEDLLKDLEKLIFKGGTGYKKQHKKSSLAVGCILLALGITTVNISITGKSLAPELGVGLIIFSLVLLLQYLLLTRKDRRVMNEFYKKGIYWIFICCCFIGLIVLGTVLNKTPAYLDIENANRWLGLISKDLTIRGIIGENLVEKINWFLGLDFNIIGKLGIALCIYWIVRERVLVLVDKAREKGKAFWEMKQKA